MSLFLICSISAWLVRCYHGSFFLIYLFCRHVLWLRLVWSSHLFRLKHLFSYIKYVLFLSDCEPDVIMVIMFFFRSNKDFILFNEISVIRTTISVSWLSYICDICMAFFKILNVIKHFFKVPPPSIAPYSNYYSSLNGQMLHHGYHVFSHIITYCDCVH